MVKFEKSEKDSLEKSIKLVYVAGKYTAKNKFDRNQNINEARIVGLNLWKLGYATIIPHCNTAKFEDYDPLISWEVYMSGYLEMVSRCDAVVLVNNYKNSRGALMEKKFAEDNNIPVYESIDEMIADEITSGNKTIESLYVNAMEY